MNYKIKFTPENAEWQALNLQNVQDKISTIERLRLLMARASKFKNQKKYFKDNNNLELLRDNLSKSFQKVLDFLIAQGSNKRSFYFSQTKIAEIIGCDRITVQRATSYFESKGLLIKHRKDTWSVCLFIMNNKIYQHARGFKHKFLSLTDFLKDLWNNGKDKNVTPYIKENEYINKIVIDPSRIEQFVTHITNKLMNKIRYKTKYTLPSKLLITPTLKEIIRELNLNELGRLKLLIFPDNVLREQWDIVKNNTKAFCKYSKLFTQSVFYCKQRQLPIEWNLYYAGMKDLDLIDNGKYFFRDNEIDYMNTMIHIYGNDYKPELRLVDPDETFLIFNFNLSHYAYQSTNHKKIISNPINNYLNNDSLRVHSDKKQPHPLFAEFVVDFIENKEQQ